MNSYNNKLIIHSRFSERSKGKQPVDSTTMEATLFNALTQLSERFPTSDTTFFEALSLLSKRYPTDMDVIYELDSGNAYLLNLYPELAEKMIASILLTFIEWQAQLKDDKEDSEEDEDIDEDEDSEEEDSVEDETPPVLVASAATAPLVLAASAATAPLVLAASATAAPLVLAASAATAPLVLAASATAAPPVLAASAAAAPPVYACVFGERCWHKQTCGKLHPEAGRRVCTYAVKGVCTRGVECRFWHPPAGVEFR